MSGRMYAEVMFSSRETRRRRREVFDAAVASSMMLFSVSLRADFLLDWDLCWSPPNREVVRFSDNGEIGLLIGTGDKTRASFESVVFAAWPGCESVGRSLLEARLAGDLLGDSNERLKSKSSSSTRVEALFLFTEVDVFLDEPWSSLSSRRASSRSRVRVLIVFIASLRSRCRVRRDATICFSSAGIV